MQTNNNKVVSQQEVELLSTRSQTANAADGFRDCCETAIEQDFLPLDQCTS